MEEPGESQQTGGETIGPGVSRHETCACVCIKKGAGYWGSEETWPTASYLCVGVCVEV